LRTEDVTGNAGFATAETWPMLSSAAKKKLRFEGQKLALAY
jgi:hypothetical protein